MMTDEQRKELERILVLLPDIHDGRVYDQVHAKLLSLLRQDWHDDETDNGELPK